MRDFIKGLAWMGSACALVIVCVGCDKAKEMAAEKVIETAASANGEKVDVDLSGGKMTVKTEDGTTKVEEGKATFSGADGSTVRVEGDSMEMTSQDGNVKMTAGDKAAIPADFPKDVPVYPGAKAVLAATDAAEQSMTVNLETKDAVDKVSEYITKETLAQGWKEEMVMKQPGDQPMHMFSYRKDNRVFMCTITGGAEGTTISMSIDTEEAPAVEAAEPAETPEAAPAETPQPAQ